MKTILIAALMLVIATTTFASFDVNKNLISNETWSSGVPLGGLGCGKVEILTDGSIGNYTQRNYASVLAFCAEIPSPVKHRDASAHAFRAEACLGTLRDVGVMIPWSNGVVLGRFPPVGEDVLPILPICPIRLIARIGQRRPETMLEVRGVHSACPKWYYCTESSLEANVCESHHCLASSAV